MRRTKVLVALVVVVGMLVAPAAGVLAQEETDTDDDIAPGERLSGVVGVQQAEFDGEIEGNAYAIALDRADDNATKAIRIAEKVNQTEQRLDELRDRKAELQQQRESGEISEGQYRARTAKLATEIETANQQLNRSDATAAELPEDTLRENGVNVSNIRTLMDSANELSGGEVAEIARGIAGDRSGMVDRGAGAGDDRAGDRGSDRSGDRGANSQGGDAHGDDAESAESTDDEQTADEYEDEDGTDDEDSDDVESGSGNGNAEAAP